MDASVGTPATGHPMICPACGDRVFAKDHFCEACGRRLGPPVHVEIDRGVIAGGVSDQGLRHSRNEDAMALKVLAEAVVAVVCDGVSASPRPQDAARIAAQTGATTLAERLESGVEREQATRAAAAKAAVAVAALADAGGAPACTYVSVIVGQEQVTVGWVGDSRAYWLAPVAASHAGTATTPTGVTGRGTTSTGVTGLARAGPGTTDPAGGMGSGHARPSAVLTQDDSWAVQMVALGVMSQAQAQAAGNAHALTGWLGADADDIDPHVAIFTPGGPGTVLICSDGLWNYLPAAEQLAAVVANTMTGVLVGNPAEAVGAPLIAARSLVRTALGAGGRDNVTAVVIPFPPPPCLQSNGPLTTEPTE